MLTSVMADAFRVTWILGSGFSKPLGGPLLADLLKPLLIRRVVFWLRNELKLPDNTCVGIHDLLLSFAGQKEPVAWTDAEELFELVDLASQGDASAKNVLGLPGGQDWGQARQDMAAYLAAACDHFVPTDASRRTERWEPYRRWGSSLTADDTVVTFNYDRVAEVACEANRVTHCSTAALPGSGGDGEGLFKLHGSADWCRNGSAYETVKWHDRVSNGYPYEPAIASPGPTKMNAVARDFQSLWNAAMRRVQDANVIVFIGYRFPESDAHAKKQLLDAISANASERLVVRVVLGPPPHPDITRIQGMLTWALSKRRTPVKVTVEPMWGQDFLAVFDREKLR